MVASRPKVSFWHDGTTSPGNYGYAFCICPTQAVVLSRPRRRWDCSMIISEALPEPLHSNRHVPNITHVGGSHITPPAKMVPVITSTSPHASAFKQPSPRRSEVVISHISDIRHVSVAMQRLVDFISMVTQQYVTTQQYQSGHSYGKKLRFLLGPPNITTRGSNTESWTIDSWRNTISSVQWSFICQYQCNTCAANKVVYQNNLKNYQCEGYRTSIPPPTTQTRL
jgi:hypothetical protein